MLSRPISTSASELVSHYLAAVGQPVRVRLLDALDRRAEAPVGVLADDLGISVHDTSRHLAVLRAAGLVERRKSGRFTLYRLVDRTPLEIYEQVAVRLRERWEASAERHV